MDGEKKKKARRTKENDGESLDSSAPPDSTPLDTKVVKSKSSAKRRDTKKTRISMFGRNSKSLIDEGGSGIHSDNSESKELFDEINWEENLEIDTSELVDEFAPVPRVESPAPTDNPSTPNKEEVQFTTGSHILIKDYTTSVGNPGIIAEVDWEENEVLVQYQDSTLSQEWISMSSQRISHNHSKTVSTPKIAPVSEVSPLSETSNSPTNRVLQMQKLKNKKKSLSLKKMKKLKEKVPTEDPPAKFMNGEKVLAKWSDHRMHKFPAVVKKNNKNGTYDVLFYDGFEKTINEEHLYKASEEEVAKYQHANPSEADLFVDMDADSKEARRQRKRKTFDDFVFSEELKPKKKPDSTKTPRPRSSIVRKKKSIESEKPKDDIKIEIKVEQSSSTVEDERIDKQETPLETPQEIDSMIDIKPVVKVEPRAPNGTVETQPPVEAPQSPIRERFSGTIPPNTKPIVIPSKSSIGRLKGRFRKSAIMPDSQLPPGWVKHVIRHNDTYKAFLMAPDGHRLTSVFDLEGYCTYVLRIDPPQSIDFLFEEKLLSKLYTDQEKLETTTHYIPWTKKKNREYALRIKNETMQKTGGVRTLLPKTRSPSSPSSSAPIESEGDVWKCVKEGCDKKFRKESLLQMHIKHYHVELKALAGAAPNMVDLACARSESNYFEPVKYRPYPDTPKPSHSIKRSLPKQSHPVDQLNRSDSEFAVSPSHSSSSPHPVPLMSEFHRRPLDDRKIKTMLPLRSHRDVNSRVNFDSDEVDSDEDPGKFQRMNRKRMKFDSGYRDFEHPNSPSYKFTKKISAMEKLHVTTDSNDSFTEEEKVSPNIEFTDDGVVIERLRSEEIINCTCNFREEDGLMIQCDICMCWQHGLCSGIDSDSEVPERYVCYICRHPTRVRSSKKYNYALHYLTQGKLPSFSFRSRNERDLKQRENLLKRCYEISSNLHKLQYVERSVGAKINIAEQPNHPKLYLWAKNWDEATASRNLENDPNFQPNQVPVPEAPIESDDCRLKLLEHVDQYLTQYDAQLNALQTQIADLESQDPSMMNDVPDKVMTQTVQMLQKDLKTVQKLASLS